MSGTPNTYNFCRLIIALGLLCAVAGAAGKDDAPAKQPLRKFTARDIVIYTDLPNVDAREALLRVTAMTEMFSRRIEGFPGEISRDQLFYFYRNLQDYRASLNPSPAAGSCGVYTGGELRAAIDISKFSRRSVWHVVQHEGWHGFAHKVITPKARQLPIWLDEALAEYFGEAVWTGDDFVAGVIDPQRLRRVQKRIRKRQFRPWKAMITLPREKWGEKLNVVNHDQVWSMAQFFLHSDGGKYRKDFAAYCRDIAGGMEPLPAFQKRFRQDPELLQKAYEQWWLGLGENPTAGGYDEITIRTLMSFLSRAYLAGARFKSAKEFFDAGQAGKCNVDIKKNPSRWLPDHLLKKALAEAKKYKRWELKADKQGRPVLRLHRPDGTTLTATFSAGKTSSPKITVTAGK